MEVSKAAMGFRLVAACALVVRAHGRDTVYKFTKSQDMECSEAHDVCIYGLCCADGDPGLQCRPADLPRWAPDAMQLENRCENGGQCMRRLIDADNTEIIDLNLKDGLCVPNSFADAEVDCSATFVPGDQTSCTEPTPGKPRACKYVPPDLFDGELGVYHRDGDGIPIFNRNLPAQSPGFDGAEATQVWVRYCRCPENFYGGMCEMEMDPATVILYAIFSLVVTTLFFSTMLAHQEDGDRSVVVGRYFREHLLTAPRRGNRPVLGQNDVDQRMLAVAVMVGAFEQLMMVAGVLSRSVAWSKDFLLVDVLQDVFLTLIDLFSTLSAIILPDNWTTANTFQIQILLALPIPIYGAVEHFKRRNERRERETQLKAKLRRVAHLHRGSTPYVVQEEVERERQAEMARIAAETEARLRQFRLTTLLPLLVLPVSGCLFKPIVGCNFLATSMNPQSVDSGGIQPQHSSARPPPDEELFAPKSMQLQCSYGAATTTYFWLGVICFLPFWIVALIANTQQQSQKSVFALHTAYRAWHTQLQVCCAMAWRSFSGANPTALTFLLTTLIAIELLLVWRWQPSNVMLINQARLQGSFLALLWGLCGCVAAVINDSADDTSGVLVVLASSVWLGTVGFWNRKLLLALCCCVLDTRLAPADSSSAGMTISINASEEIVDATAFRGEEETCDGQMSLENARNDGVPLASTVTVTGSTTIEQHQNPVTT